MWIGKGTLKGMDPCSGVSGSDPRTFFGFEGRAWCFLGHFMPTPIHQKSLFIFILISGKVLGVGKKSEIRLKSEESVPCH